MAKKYTPTQKCNEAMRILGTMRNQYPAHIEAGKITAEEAERRITTLEEIAEDYEEAGKRSLNPRTHLQIAAYALRRIKDATTPGTSAHTMAADALREMISE